MNEQYPLIYESCKIVKGASNAIIIDLQRNIYYPVSSDVIELLQYCEGNKTVSDIKKIYGNKYDDIIEENLKFFEKNEVIFFTRHPDWFPKISEEWDTPSTITNAIIDISSIVISHLDKIITQLENCGCRAAQIRCYDTYKISELKKWMEKFSDKGVTSVELMIKFSPELNTDKLKQLVEKHPRIFFVIIHSAPNEEQAVVNKSVSQLYFTTKKLTSERCCGQMSMDFFSTNLNFYTESLNHNSCLNRKISIDKDGNIKNCPSMPQSFGNIKDTTLAEAIEKPDFKKYWNINKDKIHVCKDCEFRYICTDCRAYVEDPEDILSKPLKCGYNPYTGEWSEWSTNPLKQKAIEHYGMQDLIAETKQEV